MGEGKLCTFLSYLTVCLNLLQSGSLLLCGKYSLGTKKVENAGNICLNNYHEKVHFLEIRDTLSMQAVNINIKHMSIIKPN